MVSYCSTPITTSSLVGGIHRVDNFGSSMVEDSAVRVYRVKMPRSPGSVNSISPADRVQTCATDVYWNWVSCPTRVQGSESCELGGGSSSRQLVNNISELWSVDVIAPQIDSRMELCDLAEALWDVSIFLHFQLDALCFTSAQLDGT